MKGKKPFQKDVSYFFNFMFFRKVIEKGNLQ